MPRLHRPESIVTCVPRSSPPQVRAVQAAQKLESRSARASRARSAETLPRGVRDAEGVYARAPAERPIQKLPFPGGVYMARGSSLFRTTPRSHVSFGAREGVFSAGAFGGNTGPAWFGMISSGEHVFRDGIRRPGLHGGSNHRRSRQNYVFRLFRRAGGCGSGGGWRGLSGGDRRLPRSTSGTT